MTLIYKVNKPIEWKLFIDSVGTESALCKNNFLSKGFAAFCVTYTMAIVIGQIAMSCKEWFNRKNEMACNIAFDTSLSLLFTSR